MSQLFETARPGRRHAEHAGLHLSVRALLGKLAGIEETVLLYQDGSKDRPHSQHLLTDTTPTQQRLADACSTPAATLPPLNQPRTTI